MAGIDTVGGVRVPAGFCGILGFRPSLGAVSHIGIIPVSTSLDTIGTYDYNSVCYLILNNYNLHVAHAPVNL